VFFGSQDADPKNDKIVLEQESMSKKITIAVLVVTTGNNNNNNRRNQITD
jgi:hypothetical protein